MSRALDAEKIRPDFCFRQLLGLLNRERERERPLDATRLGLSNSGSDVRMTCIAVLDPRAECGSRNSSRRALPIQHQHY